MSLDAHVAYRSRLRAAALSAAFLLVSALAVVAVPGVAHATTPPFEPDPLSIGGLTFFDATGNVVTGGSITDDPLAAYVQASTAGRAGDDKATLFGYVPKLGVASGAWGGEGLTASDVYPNVAAPAALAGSPLPLVTGTSGDLTLANLMAAFPNNDTSSDGYAGLYQLRLKTSGPGQSAAGTYDSADIMIAGSTWSVVYSNVTSTPTTTTTVGSSTSSTSTTTSSSTSTTATSSSTTSTTISPTAVVTMVGLSASPTDPVSAGSTVTLTATLTPSDAVGSVQFLDGSAALGGPVVVASGTATTTTTTLEVGTDSLSAQFTPDDPTAFGASISPEVSYTVTAATSAATTTTTVTTLSSSASSSGATSSSSLALTGADAARSAAGGIVLVLLGLALVLTERRRRRIALERAGISLMPFGPPSPFQPPPLPEEPPCLS